MAKHAAVSSLRKQRWAVICAVFGLVVLMWSGANQVLCMEIMVVVPEESSEAVMQSEGLQVNVVCDVCLEGFTEAQLILSDPLTRQQAIDLISQVTCQSLIPSLKAKCNMLVDVYATEFMERLDSFTPEEFCETTHLCKSATESAIRESAIRVANLNRNDCAICQFVVMELKIKLRDPVTQVKLLEVLLNGCNRVQNHVDECRLIVEEYAPFILANLDNILDADALCGRIGVCSTNKAEPFETFLVLPSEGQAKRVHAL